MNEFQVECYIGDNNTQVTKLSNLEEQDMLSWKKDMEVRALSEYHNKKIKVKSKKI